MTMLPLKHPGNRVLIHQTQIVSSSREHAALKTGILDKAKTQPNPSQVDQSSRADHEDVASSDKFSTPPGEAIGENETSAAHREIANNQKPDQPKSNLVQLLSRLTRHKAKVEETNEKQRLLRDMTEGLNKQNDNPAQRKITPQAGEVHDTSAGASISACNERISTYRSDKSTLDGESYDVHTQQATSHNSNQFRVNHT